MKPKEVARLLIGSSVVYVLVCACAATGGKGFGADDAGIVGSIVDAMLGHDDTGSSGASGSSSSSSSSTTSSGGKDGSGGDGASGGIFGPKDALAAESGTRLKARRYVSADGAKLPTGTFWDTTRNEECTFGAAADGFIRCMPTAMPVLGYYGDSGCSQLLGYTASGCTPAGYVSTSDTSCVGTKTHRFVTGAQFVGAQVFAKSGASCVGLATPQNFTFYQMGAEVPAATFQQATVQNDP